MKLANIFPKQATAAVMAGMLFVLPGAFNNEAQAQEPAVKPNTPAAASLVSHTGPAVPGKMAPSVPNAKELTPVEGATKFSKKGAGLYLLLKEGETLETYKADLAWLMVALKKAGVPARIYADVTGKFETQLYGIVDGVTYGRTEYVDYGEGYTMNQMGEAASDLIRAYHEAFPNGAPKTASATAAHDAPVAHR